MGNFQYRTHTTPGRCFLISPPRNRPIQPSSAFSLLPQDSEIPTCYRVLIPGFLSDRGVLHPYPTKGPILPAAPGLAVPGVSLPVISEQGRGSALRRERRSPPPLAHRDLRRPWGSGGLNLRAPPPPVLLPPGRCRTPGIALLERPPGVPQHQGPRAPYLCTRCSEKATRRRPRPSSGHAGRAPVPRRTGGPKAPSLPSGRVAPARPLPGTGRVGGAAPTKTGRGACSSPSRFRSLSPFQAHSTLF